MAACQRGWHGGHMSLSWQVFLARADWEKTPEETQETSEGSHLSDRAVVGDPPQGDGGS